MPKINIEIPHKYPVDEAKDRVQRVIEYAREKSSDKVKDSKEEWDGNVLNYSFKTMGLTIKGAVTVMEGKVTVQSDIPFAAIMFKGQIESSIKDALERALR